MDTATTIKPSSKEFSTTWIPRHNAKVILEAAQNNSLPFIPYGKNELQVTPVYHATRGFLLGANELIQAQILKQQNGYESNFVGSKQTLNKAFAHMDQGQSGKAVWSLYKGQDEKWHASQLYFGDQLSENTRAVFDAYAKENFRQVSPLKGQTLSPSSVEDYMPVYLACCKSGATMSVTPELAREFNDHIVKICQNQMKVRNIDRDDNVPKLGTFLVEADRKASEIVKDQCQKLGVRFAPERKQQQKPQEWFPFREKRLPVSKQLPKRHDNSISW